MQKILIVSAHPDDETLFCGGTIAMYARNGHHVFILETTRGEGGEVGDPPLTDKARLGEVREQETRNAARALGAKDIFFLPFIDPHMEIGGTARAIDVSLADFSCAVSGYVDEIGPDLVITHGSNGEYGHPQHVYTHRAVRQAVLVESRNIPLLSWQAYHTSFPYARVLNADDPADIVRDITPWKDRKAKAALCHKTQHAMFRRNTGVEKVEDMIWTVESFHILKGPVPPGL